MQNEKYWHSKIPLSLALLFLVNVFLIVGAELLFFYRYPAQPDAYTLAKFDSVYEGSTILHSDSISYLTASLVETADGQTHLVVIRSHGVAYGRGKIIYSEPVEITNSEQTVYVKNGIHTSEIRITGGDTVTIHYGYSGGVKEATTRYMFLGAVLEALELLVWHFIKKNLQ